MSAKDTLKAQISAILEREVVIEKPKDKTLAHYATPLAFGLAKELKKSPVVIAAQMAQQFSSPNYEVTAVNGYINFKLSGDFLDSLANDAL
ncbi:MAG: arginine--tRNA ligase, partial [Campylobacter sp.]|nr:arginine--tRNA ligase [Campylobacter sp.]